MRRRNTTRSRRTRKLSARSIRMRSPMTNVCELVRNVRIVLIRTVLVFVVLFAALGAYSPVAAQGVATGSIAGVVKDASGGVLPGVTVEASSPVLIEKSRTA